MKLLIVVVFSGALISGCAQFANTSPELEIAQDLYHQINRDPAVLQAAPKDVVRAAETLARAERLSSYWGSAKEVAHFAYLSQVYSKIAQEQAALAGAAQQQAKVRQQIDNLQLTLREAKLLSPQQRKQWAQEQLLNLNASETERGLVITLGDVFFTTESSRLNAQASRTILKLAHFLQLYPKRVIRIEGYTDSFGKTEFNLELSRQRAQSVADILLDLGIEPNRISVTGYGEAFPLADNASNRGRAQNRRVEVVFSNQQGQLSPPRIEY